MLNRFSFFFLATLLLFNFSCHGETGGESGCGPEGPIAWVLIDKLNNNKTTLTNFPIKRKPNEEIELNFDLSIIRFKDNCWNKNDCSFTFNINNLPKDISYSFDPVELPSIIENFPSSFQASKLKILITPKIQDGWVYFTIFAKEAKIQTYNYLLQIETIQ